mmetsp:Transcript_10343/g.23602  ORF Transcript_10343/g.23602 Transcript_10343/m.23602 type:complete len:260 (-) Transcript_10343:2800-3579(-)
MQRRLFSLVLDIDVRLVCEQRLHRLRVPPRRGPVQARVVVLIEVVHFCEPQHHPGHHYCSVAGPRSVVHRRVLLNCLAKFIRHVGARVGERGDTLGVALGECQVRGNSHGRVHDVRISSRVEECLYDVQMSGSRRQVQRRAVHQANNVRIGLVCEQESRARAVPSQGCVVQGSVMVHVLEVHRRLGLQQRSHGRLVPLKRSQVQSTPSVLSQLHVRVHVPGRQEQQHTELVPSRGGVVQCRVLGLCLGQHCFQAPSELV